MANEMEVIVRFTAPEAKVRATEKPVFEVQEREWWEWVLLPLKLLLCFWAAVFEGLDNRKPISRVEIRIHR